MMFGFVHRDQFYACDHGERLDEYRAFQSELPLRRFDFSSAQWSNVRSRVSANCKPEELRLVPSYWREERGLGGVCCAVLGDCAYTLGRNWKYECCVHELNLEIMEWRRLEPLNREDGPMCKKNAGMVVCGDDALCVFGGYGLDTGRHQPGATYHTDDAHPTHCWTNELHLFHISTGVWSSPEITGPWPPPCEGFSLTKVDLFRAIMFGGIQRHQILNELRILDMDNWYWSGAILPTVRVNLWPKARYLHSACALFGPTSSSASEESSKEFPHSPFPDMSTGQQEPQVFILWGLGDGVDHDGWILDVNSLTWKQAKMPPMCASYWCFCLGCHNRTSTEAELIVYVGQLSDATLIHLGVKSLYHSCVDYVAERYKVFQPLVQLLLPPRIQADICREKDKRARYRVVQT